MMYKGEASKMESHIVGKAVIGEAVTESLWEDVRSLRPIIEAAGREGDHLRRLPDSVADAFVERDVYRLILPRDLGGRGIDPLLQFDLAEEVSSYDGSVGWNFAIGSTSGAVGGAFPRELTLEIFSGPDQGIAVSGAPVGRAVAVDGGYRVSGTFPWGSTVHQAAWVGGGCFVYDGDRRRADENGVPVMVHVLVPKNEVTILDTWHVSGMRGTGSTEFVIDDVFVPDARTFTLFGGVPDHPSPLFRTGPTIFGFAISSVPLGIARSAVEALKDLAARKAPPPPRLGLADQQFTQYTVAKTEAMVDAARLSVRHAFSIFWGEVCSEGPTMESRARLRRAIVHAGETSVEAVQMICRAAGGNAIFESEPFERAQRDVNASIGHLTMQRAMMEDCGRVALGKAPLLGIF